MEQQQIVQLLTAITAVLAVVIGPFISLLVAKRQSETALDVSANQSKSLRETSELQARTDVLSKNRQDWINSLRNEISDFLVCVFHVSVVAEIIKTEDRTAQLVATMKDVLLHLSKVKLMINPKEDDHNNLIKIMEEMYHGLKTPGYDFQKAETELVKLAQILLKREWERVKSFS